MNTDWTELIFTVASSDARTAEGLLASCSPMGIYVEDYSDMEAMLPLIGAADYISEELTRKNRESAAIHLYIPAQDSAETVLLSAAELLNRAGIAFTQQDAALPTADWANDWKKQHKPHRVGKRLLLCPTWETPSPLPGDVVLSIDPGGAFGSGEDVTTTLCLALLESVLKVGNRVLDMGCGSGVLSVAALLLGAKSALGIDIEPRVLTEAPQNAELNGVSADFSVLCGNVLTDERFFGSVPADFDLICGNMVADVQLLMTDFYRKKLKSGGMLVLSGILSTRTHEVKRAMAGAGFSFVSELAEDDWRALAYKK